MASVGICELEDVSGRVHAKGKAAFSVRLVRQPRSFARGGSKVRRADRPGQAQLLCASEGGRMVLGDTRFREIPVVETNPARNRDTVCTLVDPDGKRHS